MSFPTASWVVPFVCLGLIALATAKPEPQNSLPGGERVVVDVRGKEVHIALPFRGAVLTRGTEIPGYLKATGDPGSLLAVTAQHMNDRVRGHLIGRIFPGIADNPRIWASEGISDANGPKVEIERLLEFDPGVFMGWYTLAEPIERVGLPFVGFRTFPGERKDLSYGVTAYAGVVGKPERAAAILARQDAIYRDLEAELRIGEGTARPRYLYMMGRADDRSVTRLGAKNHYNRFFAPPAGLINACACQNFYETVDAEHIIAEDPDIIVLDPHPGNERPDEFETDPRWRALSATLNHRVYRGPPGLDQYIESPFWSRWIAELAYPDRLRPKVRGLYRDYVEWLLGYRLSDDELDIALSVEDNRAMVNHERIERQETAE